MRSYINLFVLVLLTLISLAFAPVVMAAEACLANTSLKGDGDLVRVGIRPGETVWAKKFQVVNGRIEVKFQAAALACGGSGECYELRCVDPNGETKYIDGSRGAENLLTPPEPPPPGTSSGSADGALDKAFGSMGPAMMPPKEQTIVDRLPDYNPSAPTQATDPKDASNPFWPYSCGIKSKESGAFWLLSYGQQRPISPLLIESAWGAVSVENREFETPIFHCGSMAAVVFERSTDFVCAVSTSTGGVFNLLEDHQGTERAISAEVIGPVFEEQLEEMRFIYTCRVPTPAPPASVAPPPAPEMQVVSVDPAHVVAGQPFDTNVYGVFPDGFRQVLFGNQSCSAALIDSGLSSHVQVHSCQLDDEGFYDVTVIDSNEKHAVLRRGLTVEDPTPVVAGLAPVPPVTTPATPTLQLVSIKTEPERVMVGQLFDMTLYGVFPQTLHVVWIGKKSIPIVYQLDGKRLQVRDVVVDEIGAYEVRVVSNDGYSSIRDALWVYDAVDLLSAVVPPDPDPVVAPSTPPVDKRVKRKARREADRAAAPAPVAKPTRAQRRAEKMAVRAKAATARSKTKPTSPAAATPTTQVMGSPSDELFCQVRTSLGTLYIPQGSTEYARDVYGVSIGRIRTRQIQVRLGYEIVPMTAVTCER